MYNDYTHYTQGRDVKTRQAEIAASVARIREAEAFKDSQPVGRRMVIVRLRQRFGREIIKLGERLRGAPELVQIKS